MGVLDGLLQQVMQETGGQSHEGLASSLLQALGGASTSNTSNSGLAGLLGGAPGGGGLAGLVQAFEQGGLGQQAASWVGTGPNQSISADHVQQVFGSSSLQQLAAQHGIDPQQIGGQLAQLLPAVVNALTPHGTITSSGSPLDSFGVLLGGGQGRQG
jgi:uncharacterized protein YidB (DUF937 family)